MTFPPSDAIGRRRFLQWTAAAAVLPLAGSPVVGIPRRRARLRDLGITVGHLAPGPHNAITDVAGVRVGHVTLIEGDGPLQVGRGPVRTGVTAILPHEGNLTREQLYAADFTLNGNGEMTGLGYIRQTGRLGSPILFTNTSSVGAVYDAAVGQMLEVYPELFHRSPHPVPVVGETWADFLNDTAGRHLKAHHVRGALNAASPDAVAEGCVGGGTGMRAFDFKAGIGTASRYLPELGPGYTVGVLVQANFGRRQQLRVDGVPVGREIPDLLPEKGSANKSKSLLVAIATNAPLMPIQLKRLCKRAGIGMARTGGISTHGSGDLVLAFSTAKRLSGGEMVEHTTVADSALNPLFQAVVEATEEAILNSLTTAYTMVGRDGNTFHALPLDRLIEVMRAHGRIK
jgi:D-aminopeptidase